LKKKLKIIGYICVGFGIIAAFLCIAPVLGITRFSFGVFYAILSGFLGMVTSAIYVFIDTRNEINKNRFTAGVLGMILSSVPIIFMLAIIVMSKMNH
jgi:hypothetical protein